MTGARKQVNVVFPYGIYRALSKYATKRDVPVSHIVREAVVMYLESRKNPSDFGEEEK